MILISDTLLIWPKRAKIQWAIEGDENSKYFHGIINKKRSQLAIRGVLVDGEWIEDPPKVKNEFLEHFSNRFSMPTGQTINLDSHMFQKISIDQNADLESDVSLEEIKKAVWECGTNKSPGPDGFSFEFIRKYWNIIQHDVRVDSSVSFSSQWASILVIEVLSESTFIKVKANVHHYRLICLNVSIGVGAQNHYSKGVRYWALVTSQEELMWLSKDSSLWYRVIKAMFGDGGALDNTGKFARSSTWTTIVRECGNLSSKGINLLSHMKRKVGNGLNTLFWVDSWLTDIPLKQLYPRMFALDCNKNSTVAEKINASSISCSFRRLPRGSLEEEQFSKLIEDVNSVILSVSNDRWIWSLDSSGEFSIKSTRLFIDDHLQ
ncbi:hypothetical protein Tco_0904173 [Tanacetum coccineum]